jgi:hypothetical protein
MLLTSNLTPTESVLQTLVKAGGTMTLGQISTATNLKRVDVENALKSLAAAGKTERVGGSIWRTVPGIAAAAVEKKVAAAPKPKRRKRKATRAAAGTKPRAGIGRSIYDFIEKEGGTSTPPIVTAGLRLPLKKVRDNIYHLRNAGWLVSNGDGTYTLKGYEAAPVAPQTASEARVLKDGPEPAPKAAALAEDVQDLVGELLALAAPDGVPATSAAAYATAEFVTAAEKLIRIARA